jgi:hypothetical protein
VDFARQRGALVVQRHQHAEQFEIRIGTRFNFSIVSSRSSVPSSAKYDDWIGINTCDAATSALTVIRPSVGGVSITMTSYCFLERLETIFQPERRVEIADQLRFEFREIDARRNDVRFSPALHKPTLRPAPVRPSSIRRQIDRLSGSRNEMELLACGSRSRRRTRFPLRAKAAARLMAVVVFPTPPF